MKSVRAGRLIVIGDVHGCADELAALIDKVELRSADRLILLGDLVNRGPDSHGVLQLAREHATAALLGNHELRLLNFRKTDDPTHLKRSDYATIEQLDGKDWAYLERMPLTVEEEDFGVVCVHGGFLPGLPWRKQPARVVTRIQVVDADGEPRKRSEAPGAPHWSELWKGPPFVVYGHTPRETVQRTKWTLGLDTGCVLGGHLTAYVLPEDRLVQVRAKRRYYSSG